MQIVDHDRLGGVVGCRVTRARQCDGPVACVVVGLEARVVLEVVLGLLDKIGSLAQSVG